VQPVLIVEIMSHNNNILPAAVAEKKLSRMALEIAERNYAESEIILLGIKDNGTVIAKKIAAYLSGVFKGTITVLDLYIDKRHPGEITITPATDFNNKTVILVDDVANSGRVMLYALKPLLDQHPKKIQTLALVERTHKSFPVSVDYVGLSVSTTPDEHIYVDVENGEVMGARMEGND
jgi:pyrimidine operon attenuation protein / uracil phosphoribosyltransferase